MNIAYFDFINPINDKLSLNATSQQLFHSCGGNTGNLVHINAYLDILHKHKLVHCSMSDTETINKQDMLLIICANQIGNHNKFNNNFLEQLDQVKIPVIACSLGAQNGDMQNVQILSDPAAMRNIDFFKMVSNKRISSHSNISVRGLYTKKVLSFYGIEDTFVTGCITSMLFKDNIGSILKNKYHNKSINNVCVAGNNPFNHCRWIEKPLMELVENFNGIHIIQSPLVMLCLASGENIEDDIGAKLEQIYKMSKKDIQRWFVKYSKFYMNTNHWLDTLKLYDLVLGTRYHGVAIGIQAGIMGTVFSIDSRTEEMAEMSGIKCIPVDLLKHKTARDILDMSIWTETDFLNLDLQVEFSKNQFRSFFDQNGISI
jgi:hypothetical protein